METITINKGQLQGALQQWEQDARDGKTLSAEESRARPLDEVAQSGADRLWGSLTAQVAAAA